MGDHRSISRDFRRGAQHCCEPLRLGDAEVYFHKYTSKYGPVLLGQPSYTCAEHGKQFPAEPVESTPGDCDIEENLNFRYILIRGSEKPPRPHRQVLIVSPGINERDWTKYIQWGHAIWQQNGVPVILFPLAFGIDRVYGGWLPQVPASLALRREIVGNEYEHNFNATISERLSAHSERLMWGAVQSCKDLIDFVRGIRLGENPLFARHARVDFFGYSAGGFISLTLLMENHERLFDDSRVCLFASCVAMRDLAPATPYILDRAAESALRRLYVDHFDTLPNERMRHWLEEHPEGRWLREFCGLRPNRTRSERRLREIATRVLGIANSNDHVFTYGAMLNALQGVKRDTGIRVESLDLGIHENPFGCPDYNQRDSKVVTVTLDEQLYGDDYKQFIHWIVEHLSR
jgi:Family of unknown function (DUF6051)